MKPEITDEMVAIAKKAGIDRLMSDDGCPEGEALRASIEAVATMIAAEAYKRGQEDMREQAAKIADEKGWKNARRPATVTEEYGHDMADEIASDIRNLKE